MSTGLGAKMDAGIVKGSAWATASTVGALDGVHLMNVSPLAPQYEVIQDETLGNDFIQEIDLGRQSVDVNLTGPSRYENSQWVAVASFFGDDSQTGTSSPYTHIMDLQDETSIYYTCAATIDDMIVEYPSVKTSQFTLNTDGNGFMDFSIVGIANTVKLGADATNASGDFTNLTYKTDTLKMRFDHCRVNINAQGGADFDSSGDGTDRVYPNEITLEFSRGIVRDYLANRTTSNSILGETSEPQRDTFPQVVVNMTFPELTALSDLEAFQDETLKKMEIYFYRDANYSAKFQFPNLQPVQPTSDVAGGGRIPYTVSYFAMSAAAAPTGMTGVTAPVRLTLINATSGAYDA